MSRGNPLFRDQSEKDFLEARNARLQYRDPLEAAAYLLWRAAWIHPFGGGNGRTARMLCYLGLCVRLDSILPGEVTIPTQILKDRDRFIEALKDADQALGDSGITDVSKLKSLLDDWLKKQLASVPPPPRPIVVRPPDDSWLFEPGRVIIQSTRMTPGPSVPPPIPRPKPPDDPS